MGSNWAPGAEALRVRSLRREPCSRRSRNIRGTQQADSSSIQHTCASWKNMFLRVMRYEPVRKSCVAATMMDPSLGVHRLLTTPMSSMASVRASSVCGTCRFISSPSKSGVPRDMRTRR